MNLLILDLTHIAKRCLKNVFVNCCLRSGFFVLFMLRFFTYLPLSIRLKHWNSGVQKNILQVVWWNHVAGWLVGFFIRALFLFSSGAAESYIKTLKSESAQEIRGKMDKMTGTSATMTTVSVGSSSIFTNYPLMSALIAFALAQSTKLFTSWYLFFFFF